MESKEPVQSIKKVIAPELASIYAAVNSALEFRQGEIITGLVQYVFHPEDGSVEGFTHPYAIIASQDCDLLQDFEKTKKGEISGLNGILVYEADTAEVARPKLPPGTEYWKRVKQNTNDRHHCLQAAPAAVDSLGVGLPDLVIDFKRFFCITSPDLAHQCRTGSAKRRCRIEMPYREHFQARAAFYLQRVALPQPHQIG